jgi:hypothetical protein
VNNLDATLPGVAISCVDPPLQTTQGIDPTTGNVVLQTTCESPLPDVNTQRSSTDWMIVDDENGNQVIWPQGVKTCLQAPGQLAYAVNSLQLIVICRATIPNMPSTVGANRLVEQADGVELETQRTISNVLLHELMHLLPGNPSQYLAFSHDDLEMTADAFVVLQCFRTSPEERTQTENTTIMTVVTDYARITST